MESILEKVLKRVDSAELYYVESEVTPIEFKFDKLHSIDQKYVKGVGLRVIKDGKIGFSSTTDLSKTDELIENALLSAKFGQEAKFEFPKGKEGVSVNIVSKEIKHFPVENGVDTGKEAIELVKAGNSEIQCDVRISKGISRVRILNSNGLNTTYEKTVFSYYIIGFIILDGSFLWLSEGKRSCKLLLNTKEFVNKVLQKVELAKNVAKVPTRKMNVIFMPEAMPNLLYAVQLGTNGKQVQKGASPLTGRIGQKLLDERISIWDDGTIDYGVGSAPFDDEGMRTQKTPLFEAGVLKGFLFDLQTAGMMNAKPTGNGSRSYDSLPSPGNTNLVVNHGELSLDNMIKSVKEGIIVYDVIGGGQSNLLAGDFSLNVGLGYKIENGELVGRVKDTMVAGNVYDAFKNIIGLGDKVEEIEGTFRTPAFHFKELNVTSKQ